VSERRDRRGYGDKVVVCKTPSGCRRTVEKITPDDCKPSVRRRTDRFDCEEPSKRAIKPGTVRSFFIHLEEYRVLGCDQKKKNIIKTLSVLEIISYI
jgi:hypothetical protein